MRVPQTPDRAESGQVDATFERFLAGLRTSLPGGQVILAFLLIMPLQARFESLSDFERSVYLVAVIGAVVTNVLLIAPSAHQFLRAPATGLPRRHERDVMAGVRLAIAGMVTMAITLLAAIYLSITIVFGDWVAGVAAVGVLLLVGWAWFWLPLVVFRHHGERP